MISTAVAVGLPFGQLTLVQRAINILMRPATNTKLFVDPNDLTAEKQNWRRNLLLNSEFAGAVAGSPGTAPTNWPFLFNTGSIVSTSGGLSLSVASGQRHVFATSITLLANESRTLSIDVDAVSGGTAASLLAAAVASAGSITGTTYIPVTAGVGRHSMTFAAGASGATVVIRVGLGANDVPAVAITATVNKIQLELGSTATAYQKITDFYTEFLAAFPKHTLFQDSAGTTPVTAVGQIVGLALDKSNGLVLGPECFSDASATLTGEATRISPGVYRIYSSAGAYSGVGVSNSFVIGRTYRVSFNVDSVSVVGGGVTLEGCATISFSTAGAKSVIVTATGAYGGFKRTSSAVDIQISQVSIREIPGNHLIQPLSPARPELRRRYNRLLNSELSGAAAGSPGTAPTSWPFLFSTGSITSTLSGLSLSVASGQRHVVSQIVTLLANESCTLSLEVLAISGGTPSNFIAAAVASVGSITGQTYIPVTDGVGRKSMTFVAGAAGATVVVRVGLGANDVPTEAITATVNKVQVLPASDAHLPYQRVNTATDYDTDATKFPAYFWADGIDDCMYTVGNVDMTGTDKVTVFVAAHKASDAAGGMLCEFGTDTNASNGSFMLLYPRSVSYNEPLFGSRGTVGPVLAAGSSNAFPAPRSDVLSASSSISGDSALVRVRGIQVASSSGDQGTGNYGNYPFFLGARNASSLYFKGRIHLIAVCGSLLAAADNTTVEEYFNTQSKAY